MACFVVPNSQFLAKSASRRAVAVRSAPQRVRCEAGQSAAASASTAPTSVAVDTLFSNLDIDLDNYRRAPATLKQEVSGEVLGTVEKLADAGALKKWGAALADLPERRSLMLGELRMVGVKQPERIAELSVRNDAAFLFTVVVSTSVAAVILGQLPGDWGFFSAYLVGGITLAVLAIGSINPGILQFAIDKFSVVFPDYKQRVVAHEAAHFLTAYLLRVPVVNYSLMLGKEHTDLVEAKLQKRLIAGSLEPAQVDQLSVIAMAGATSEAMKFEDVIGQNADFFDLQRIMSRQQPRMSNAQQQNQTRWASYQAASMLRTYSKEYEALQASMASGGSVVDCIKAIEAA